MDRGQAAIEYLIIVGFALAVLGVLVVVYYEHESTSKHQIASTQIDRIGKKLVDSAEEVYFLGVPTRSTINAYFPSDVEAVTIYPREIDFSVRGSQGVSDMEYYSSVNLTGSISATQGVKYIKVIAQQGRVCLVEEGQPECP